MKIKLIITTMLYVTGVIYAAAAETIVPVEITSIQRFTFNAYVTGYGVIEAAPSQPGKPPAGSRLAPGVSGVITEVLCSEGQVVAKGQLLFRLDSRVALAELSRANANWGLAEKELARQRQLFAVEGVSQKQLQQSEAATESARADSVAMQARLALHQVSAPFTGTVLKIFASPGEAVNGMNVLAELADLQRLVASVNVPLSNVNTVKSGQAASIYPDGAIAPLKGTVSMVSPVADPQTGSVNVRLTLPAGAGLRPGQFLRARIVSATHTDRLAVPLGSVVRTDESAMIAVVKNGIASLVPVLTGLQDADLIEISGDNIQEGMTVVGSGAYGLPDQTRVSVKK